MMKTFKNMGAVIGLGLGIALTGCQEEADPNEPIRTNHGINDPQSTAAGEKNTFDHARESVGGENGITDLHERRFAELAIGAPEDVAHLHGAQKISYAALGTMLTDFGVSTQAGGAGKLTAGTLYSTGKNALGAPIFSSRTPEMSSPSTSALAKQMDIFVAAAPDVIANIGKSTRCPGVVLVNAGQLTQDGISCLTGKPASADYVALANKMVSDVGDPTKGTQIAVATILAASHISE